MQLCVVSFSHFPPWDISLVTWTSAREKGMKINSWMSWKIKLDFFFVCFVSYLPYVDKGEESFLFPFLAFARSHFFATKRKGGKLLFKIFKASSLDMFVICVSIALSVFIWFNFRLRLDASLKQWLNFLSHLMSFMNISLVQILLARFLITNHSIIFIGEITFHIKLQLSQLLLNFGATMHQ